ncbi:MAG TPA: hypothetical protein VGE90_14500 [Chitinophaga sp.]
MNKTTPYEQLITAKLDEISVPDMADSIWASIEMQLDAVPSSPDNTPKPKKTIKFNGKGWYGIAGVAAVSAMLWWYTSHKDQTTEKTTPVITVPAPQAPVIDSSTSVPPAEQQPPATIKPKKDTVEFIKELPKIDSATHAVLPAPKVDSQLLKYQSIFIPTRGDSVSMPPPKKSRGVKGISEDDYKISAGAKDSTGQKP